MPDWLADPAAWWLIAAGLLGAAELLAPGVFLLFFAIAAAVMGVFLLLFPGMPLTLQLLGFAVWAAVTVGIGRRWYHDYPVAAADPLLNDRAARLLGETVVVTQAISGGTGRVRVGDGEWLAHGEDAPAGARVRVIGVSGASVTVEPVTAGPPASSPRT